MYANTTNGHRVHVQGQKDSRALFQMTLGSLKGTLVQDTVTTVEEYLGISWADVPSVYAASESSTLNGTSRDYLGNARLTLNDGGASTWNTAVACWGTKVTSQFSRIGDTNLYRVVVTTVEYSVRKCGDGTLTFE